MRPIVEVDIWSDVVCPWCYIGKRSFDEAVERVAADVDVRVRFRPFQLDPTAKAGEPTPVSEAYAKKFGGAEKAAQIIGHVTSVAAGVGIDFRMDRALRANTLDAHRLLWLAQATGNQAALKERLLRAYFVDGRDVGDRATLAELAGEVGLSSDRVAAFLASDDGVAEIRAELMMAADSEITAVPTFVFNGRWQVPGAQDADTFATVLRRLAEKQLAADSQSDTAGEAP